MQTRDVRSVGATERTNGNSLTAFGDIPDARNTTSPTRLGPVAICAEPSHWAVHVSSPTLSATPWAGPATARRICTESPGFSGVMHAASELRLSTLSYSNKEAPMSTALISFLAVALIGGLVVFLAPRLLSDAKDKQ
jgi:hypothetical protein